MKRIRPRYKFLGDIPTKEYYQNKQKGGTISELGYSKDSPYKNNPYLDIHTPDGSITMQNTEFPLLGTDEYGNQQMMYPGNDYTFPGKKVREERFQMGGLSRYNLETEDALLRKKENQRKIDAQGSITQYDPTQKASILDKLTNPMTFLKAKIQGTRVPDNFQRGERNVLDYATDLINPYSYIKGTSDMIDAGKEMVRDPSLSNFGKLGASLPMGLPIPLAGGKVLNAIGRDINLPLGRAMLTYEETKNLPFGKRIRNAANAGAMNIPIEGDIGGHNYFNLTPEETTRMMHNESINLPEGAYTTDHSMSKNSTPLFWNSALRKADQGFTPIRTPEEPQAVNWSGYKGKRVTKAFPDEYRDFYKQDFKDYDTQSDYLKGMAKSQEPAMMDAYNRHLATPPENWIISKMKERAMENPQHTEPMLKFMENYKPTLDAPIRQMNTKTGLNFPLTTIEANEYTAEANGSASGPTFMVPNLAMVRGNPLNRYKRMPFTNTLNAFDDLNRGNPLPTKLPYQLRKEAPPLPPVPSPPAQFDEELRWAEEFRRGGTFQRGGIGNRVFSFLNDDEDEDDEKIAVTQNTAPDTNEVQLPVQNEEEDLAMQIATADYSRSRTPAGSMVGQLGAEIQKELGASLGYTPQYNSVFRTPAQQNDLIRQGLGVKNSYHLTGDAVDMKPVDWNNLGAQKQQFFRNKYDVVNHNNHYHIEPKGSPSQRHYQTGGVYEGIDYAELDRLKKQGYKFNFLD